MRLLPIIALTALLSACGTTPSRPVCLQLATYSLETQDKAADELEELEKEGKAPTVRSMFEDYGDLRARARAACS